MDFESYKQVWAQKTATEKLKQIVCEVDIYGSDCARYKESIDQKNFDDSVYWRNEAMHKMKRIQYLIGEVEKALKVQAATKSMSYVFKYVQDTIIGMNEETGELAHFNVYVCPHCNDEVTYPMAMEWKYCPKCGMPVSWDEDTAKMEQKKRKRLKQWDENEQE